MQTRLLLNKNDLNAIKRIDAFLPSEIFDAHAHIFDTSFCPSINSDNTCNGSDYFGDMQKIFGARIFCANFITYPDSAMRDKKNGYLHASDSFIISELEKHYSCVGEIMILPSESASDIEARLTHKAIRGLKCYANMINSNGKRQPALAEFLPEAAFEVANARNMAITIHLMREGLADKENAMYVVTMAEKYPNAKLILAHSARAFSSRTLVENIDTVKRYENIFFDFSAICEPQTFIALLYKVGSGRCLWGSDYPLTLPHGKAISVADSFEWLDENTLPASWPYLLENIYAVKEASDILSLGSKQIEDVFCNNAKHLFL